uniref:ATPase AAA-type core domain-containing protein n=1 Tax=Fagus sylvatica TaxID=28930 RepID=A0A2N9E203_FAGSY
MSFGINGTFSSDKTEGEITVDVFAIVALSGIVSRLLSNGTVLVATSNRAPNDLNQDGMQWEIFLKFIAKLEEHCEIVLIGSEIDYRRLIAQRSIDQAYIQL